MSVNFTDIWWAQQRLKPYLAPTPLESAPKLGKDVYLKLENTNPTHAFKIRGALNALLTLSESDRAKGIITASSGNHAQGVAAAADLTGTQARILMPQHTPRKKVDGVKRYGAEAILSGENYDETEAEALRQAREDGRYFVSAYNDAAVIAGAGTIGLEIVEQLPDVARVIVCVSGGGLISGVGTAIKALKPSAQVIGVNSQSAPHMYNIFNDTAYEENFDTLAEALSGGIEEGAITVPIAQRVVDQMVMVSEAEIAAAMHWMAEVQGWMVEGGGVVGVAAYLHGHIPSIDGKTAIVVSGGNIDLETWMQAITSST